MSLGLGCREGEPGGCRDGISRIIPVEEQGAAATAARSAGPHHTQSHGSGNQTANVPPCCWVPPPALQQHHHHRGRVVSPAASPRAPDSSKPLPLLMNIVFLLTTLE